MANYDNAELTQREKLAAKNQTKISQQNVRDVQNQLKRQLANYDFADKQNRRLADTQLQQNSRKTSADRFEAQRDLQAATLGLLGSMGSAMNGSSTGNLMSMLRSRNDKENNTYWAQHMVNQDEVENAYQDSLNQNNVARRDARQSAEKAIRDIAADWSANMNNINPKLFKQGNVGGSKALASSTAWDATASGSSKPPAAADRTRISGYVMPDSMYTTPRRQVGGTTTMPSTGTTTTTDGSFASAPSGIRDIASVVMGQGQPQQQQQPQSQRRRGNDYFSQMMSRFSGR